MTWLMPVLNTLTWLPRRSQRPVEIEAIYKTVAGVSTSDTAATTAVEAQYNALHRCIFC